MHNIDNCIPGIFLSCSQNIGCGYTEYSCGLLVLQNNQQTFSWSMYTWCLLQMGLFWILGKPQTHYLWFGQRVVDWFRSFIITFLSIYCGKCICMLFLFYKIDTAYVLVFLFVTCTALSCAVVNVLGRSVGHASSMTRKLPAEICCVMPLCHATGIHILYKELTSIRRRYFGL